MITITERTNGSKRVTQRINTPSKTEQSHRKNVNINRIMEKYHLTGHLNRPDKIARYGDFSGYSDFHGLKNRLIQAEEEFMALPSQIRRRFNNDAGEMIDFINDPENATEAALMGLIEKIEPDLTEQPVEPPEEPAEPPEEPPVE